MANEIRLRGNNYQGTLSAQLNASDTSIISSSWVQLPAVDITQEHAVLILDPNETFGAAEIVQIVSHAASGNVLTVVRGFESTTPRIHPIGTTWVWGPVASDFNFTQRTATSAKRPATPFNGEMIYETDTNRWAARSSAGVWLPSPHNPPMCRVFHNANQSVNDLTETTVAFNSERFDTDSMHDTVTNNSRITINTAGVYVVSFTGQFANRSDYFRVYSTLRVNGSLPIAVGMVSNQNGVAQNPMVFITTIYKFAVGDYVEARVFQDNNAGVASNLETGTAWTPEFSAAWIGVG